MSSRHPMWCSCQVAATLCLLSLWCIGGCATTHDTTGFPVGCTHDNRASSVEVQRGRPNRLLDGTGWVFGIPSKVALWDRRADNHDVSEQTVDHAVAYLERNNVSDVLVRINQYDPLGEWQRLAQNRHIGWGWRLTGGTLETLKYTVLPGRLFGEDWYNPFTNSIHVYSDIPVLAISEAAYAKDVQQRARPGAYATSQILPIVNMWHETAATKETLQYVEAEGTQAELEEAYRILYPSYGGNWGAGIGSFVPFGNAYARLVGAFVGHVANRIRPE